MKGRLGTGIDMDRVAVNLEGHMAASESGLGRARTRLVESDHGDLYHWLHFDGRIVDHRLV